MSLSGLQNSIDRLRKVFPPYYLQPLILLSYNITASLIFNFERPNWIFVAGVLAGLVVHCLVGHFVFGKIGNLAISCTVSFGGMLQMYSPEYWPYLILPIIGNLSKGIVLFKGRHIFNPSNLALVFMFEFFPHTVVGNNSIFSHYLGVGAIFFLLGTINVLYARQATTAFAWYIAFVVFNYVRFRLIANAPFNFALIALNPLIILFTFHMITDPMTTPITRIGKVIFAVTVALLDALMRNQNFPQSNYYALFFITAFMPLIWEFEKRWAGVAGTPQPRRAAGA
jgi:hypothetical protein